MAAPASESNEHLDNDQNSGTKSPDDLSWSRKQATMMEVYDKLIDEEAAIEIRTWQPSEEPSDKTRLPIIKQEMRRIDEALDQNQLLEDIHTAEEAEA